MNRLSHVGRRLAAALSLCCAAPVMAAVINFDSIGPDIYSSGDVLQVSAYNLLFLADPTSAAHGQSSGVGAILDGRTNSSCDIAACPQGATGNYLAILNDGGVQIARSDLDAFTLAGFDYSFLAPVSGLPDQQWGLLQLSGVLASGQVVTASLAFPGQDMNGNYYFLGASLPGALRNQLFTALTFNACTYNDAGLCSNSVDFPAFNQAQFALNNIIINAVAEPPTSMLMLAGLTAIGMLSRRRTLHRLQGA